MTSIFRSGALLIVAVLVAALSHVSAILLMPALVPVDSWSRLGTFGEAGKFALLASSGLPGESSGVPRSDPMTLMALCRYDLDETGPVRISGEMALPYWGFFAHDRRGMVYYAINNRAFGDRPLSLRVMSADDVVRFRADLPEDAEQELLVASPEARGFVIVRALVPQPAARSRIEAELRRLDCQPAGQ